jgi:hypothetical protein
MSDDPSLADHEAAFRRLSELLYGWVNSQLQAGEWREAKLDLRYAADGSYWHDKTRVTAGDGEIVSLGTTMEMKQLFYSLNKLRHVLGWYAMTMTVGRDGSVVVDYGYDPNAAEDPTFFDD